MTIELNQYEAERMSDERSERSPWSRFVVGLVAFSVIGAFSGIVWYAYSQGARQGAASGQVPTIRAETGPVKERPSDPGGLQVPHRDKLVYNQVARQPQPQSTVESLLPRIENPKPRPVPPPAPAAQPAPPPAPAAQPAPPPAIAPGLPLAVQPPAVQPPAGSPPAAQLRTAPPPAVAALPAAPALPAVPSLRSGDTQPPRSLLPPPPAQSAATATPPRAAPPAAPTAAPAASPIPAAVPDLPARVAARTEAARAPSPVPVSAPAASGPARAQPAAGGSAFRVQLGAVREDNAAKREWERLRRSYPEVLGSLSGQVVRVDLGADKGVFYRIQAGPIASADSARQACDALAKRNVRCLVVRP